MLEKYYIKPETIDRIRGSWLGEPIERYVSWLDEQGYASRNVFRRVPLLVHFGEFAVSHGASGWKDLPDHVEPFVENRVERHETCSTEQQKQRLAKEVRTPVQQMLRLVLSDYVGRGRCRREHQPFSDRARDFFRYLQEERGLRPATIHQYAHYLRLLDEYLKRVDVFNIADFSPSILSAFVIQSSCALSKSATTALCGTLRVFLRYLYREGLIDRDLSATVETPQRFRLSDIPRAISWQQVQQMLETVDRRTPIGRRDFAILLLLVTYGLRGYEVAALTLDDVDWKRERLLVPERKAGHCSAYPLSSVVGAAILDYIQRGRPQTSDHHIFFRVLAPHRPLTSLAISSRASHHLRKANIHAARAGSHTLRHTCIQHLVDANFPLKTIGDYVGHGSPSSTAVYTKVAIEQLREVAMGPGEDLS